MTYAFMIRYKIYETKSLIFVSRITDNNFLWSYLIVYTNKQLMKIIAYIIKLYKRNFYGFREIISCGTLSKQHSWTILSLISLEKIQRKL